MYCIQNTRLPVEPEERCIQRVLHVLITQAGKQRERVLSVSEGPSLLVLHTFCFSSLEVLRTAGDFVDICVHGKLPWRC